VIDSQRKHHPLGDAAAAEYLVYNLEQRGDELLLTRAPGDQPGQRTPFGFDEGADVAEKYSSTPDARSEVNLKRRESGNIAIARTSPRRQRVRNGND
jgi:hypothetical protein